MKKNFIQKPTVFSILLWFSLNIFLGCNKSNDNEFNPVLTTEKPIMTTSESATCGGNIENDGGSTITAKGVCWSTNPNPTIEDKTTSDGDGPGKFTSTIGELNAGETYYIRTYIKTNKGVWYGNECIFLTPTKPVVSTGEIKYITQTTATGTGSMISNGNAVVTSCGVCWSTQLNPTLSDSITTRSSAKDDAFFYILNGLIEGNSYYIRAYATNIMGTAYGDNIQITVPLKVTDLEGNIYKTVQIGTQIWMAENLNSTKKNDGTSLSEITVDQSWLLASNVQAYCNYSNDASNGEKYGKLYNWNAINSNKLAPVGWHIPTYDEWNILIDYVTENAEPSLIFTKSLASTTDWEESSNYETIGNNLTINNFSGFNALPGGYRDNYGNFKDLGRYCGFWTATWSQSSMWFAYYKYFIFNNNYVSYTEILKSSGLSVRCIKNQ